MRLSFVALLLVAAKPFSWTVGPQSSGAPTRPRPTETEALRGKGARVYAQRCAACHGKRGDGRGWVAPSLPIPPRDFTSGVYKLRSTPTGSIPTDEDLFATISRGMHGTPMMSWRGLPEDERWALVGHLKAYSVRFAQERPAPALAVPAEPPSSGAFVVEGARLWGARAMWRVPRRRRRPRAVVSLSRRTRGGTSACETSAGREFMRGSSARDIYLTLRTGMDGTPMGSYAEALTPHETRARTVSVRSLISPSPAKGRGADYR